MSAALAAAQIPTNCLPKALELSDFLIEDLKTLRGLLQHDRAVSASLIWAIENRMLLMLDEISPEVRHAELIAKRYAETLKIGGGS